MTDAAEYEKYLEVQDKFEAVVSFVEWVNGHGMCIAKKSTFTRPGNTYPVDLFPEEFACVFFGIDFEQLAEQKRKADGR